MAMTDADPLFVDTNVLVYANVASAPFHTQALSALEVAHQAGQRLGVSRQILREFIVARTRPQTFARPATPSAVIERVRYLDEHFHVADDTSAVTDHLVKLMRDFMIGGKQVHDANIMATLLAIDIPCLLTHNVKDFERFGDTIVIERIRGG